LASAAPNCEDKDKDKPPQLILHLREDGEPWTYDGFKTAWQREMNREVFARFREERIVFHGLRKNAVNNLLEVGCSEVLIPLDVAHHSGMISPTVPI
jgi:hypothetical protein